MKTAKKILALVLSIAMFIACVNVDLYNAKAVALTTEEFNIQLDGKDVEVVEVPQSEKIVLTVPEVRDADYHWQLAINANTNDWVSVSGQTRSFITLGYAMLRNIVDANGMTYVRCKAKIGERELTSDPVLVNISYTVPESSTVFSQESVASVFSSLTSLNGVAQQDLEQYVVEIKYLYEDGRTAFGSWSIQIAKGEDYSSTVSFPEIVGYLPYFEDDTESSLSYDVNIENIQADATYTVWYKPAEVSFKINHYIQNILDDNYELFETTTGTGLTGSQIGDGRAMDINGFTMLYYDKTITIASDGSTEVEIYYDRNYYLIYFDLDGGYGTDPVYTRSGATVSVNHPSRSGYVFEGWELIEVGTPDADGNIVYNAATDAQKETYDLDNTSISLPAMNLRYKAIWTTTNTTYTVVYWTENADDDNYTYLGSKTGIDAISAITVNAADHQTYPGTWAESAHFTYNAEKSDKNVIVEGDSSTVVNVYYTRNRYTLTFTSDIIRTLTCTTEEHFHSDDCCENGGTSYTHWFHNDSCCTLGLVTHRHGNSCYSYSDYVVTAKYDSDIAYIWENDPIKSLLDDGYVFRSSLTNKYYSFLQKVPGSDVTMTKTEWSGDTYTWYYYLEVPEGVSAPTGATTKTEGGRTYYLYHTTSVKGDRVNLTYDEDYFPITGFTQRDKVGENGWRYDDGSYKHSFDSDRTYSLYYLREQYNLEFHNYGTTLDGKGGTYYFEQLLGDVNFTPDYPDTLEPNAYEFAGWYTTPDCYDGSEFSFENAKMPAHDIALYAKWTPKTHTVRVFKTYDDIESGTTITGSAGYQFVPHANIATLPEEITNGNYVFNGWFYMDGDVKKAFDFNNMPVRKDLDIFAEWSSKVSVKYTIYYKLEDGTEIASQTIGYMLAGMSKTFSAKAGNELNAAYREGYFPNTNSHTILMEIDGANEFTFVYVPVENVPYTVKYLEKGTQNVLAEEKYVADNRRSVVTEVFVQVDGYMPDAYQKRLILSADPDENVLIFWYTEDDEHAYYIITHWVQNLDGDGYEEYRVIQGPETIGKLIEQAPLTLTGYEYKGYTVNGGSTLTTGNAQGRLEKGGLRLDLYYDRVESKYTVKYLEYGTDKVLSPDKVSTEKYRFGKVVSESAISINGYTLVGSVTKTLTIKATEADNVIIFYYSQNYVNIKYEPIGGGFVSLGSENVKGVDGPATGSSPIADTGYHFVGWYKDQACTQPVDSTWVDSTGKITPQKEGGYYTAATYYAKFAPNSADLTIKKTGVASGDSNLTFIFSVVGAADDANTKDIRLTVTVKGNGSVVIKDLPTGKYTVTELSGWSWRYEPKDAEQDADLVASGTTVTFENVRENDKWIDDEASVDNIYEDDKITAEVN